MAMTPEKKMKKKVDEVLKEAGVWFFAPQAGIYGRSGIPDRIGILPDGKFLGVEVKADPTKKPTALQMRTLQQIIDAGGEAWVVDSDMRLATFKAWLRVLYEKPKC
jgi:hypothetical protein